MAWLSKLFPPRIVAAQAPKENTHAPSSITLGEIHAGKWNQYETIYGRYHIPLTAVVVAAETREIFLDPSTEVVKDVFTDLYEPYVDYTKTRRLILTLPDAYEFIDSGIEASTLRFWYVPVDAVHWRGWVLN